MMLINMPIQAWQPQRCGSGTTATVAMLLATTHAKAKHNCKIGDDPHKNNTWQAPLVTANPTGAGPDGEPSAQEDAVLKAAALHN
jgi:hypothetical protein